MDMMVVPLQSSVKLMATLKDTDGAPLSNKPIYFYASSDRNTWTHITTVNTDGTGTATCTSSIYSWYKAEFKGDDQYDPSSIEAQYSASTASPTPTPTPTCCSFSDFSCWFFKQGKCVNIFNTTVDSMMLSVALVAVILLLLIILLK